MVEIRGEVGRGTVPVSVFDDIDSQSRPRRSGSAGRYRGADRRASHSNAATERRNSSYYRRSTQGGAGGRPRVSLNDSTSSSFGRWFGDDSFRADYNSTNVSMGMNDIDSSLRIRMSKNDTHRMNNSIDSSAFNSSAVVYSDGSAGKAGAATGRQGEEGRRMQRLHTLLKTYIHLQDTARRHKNEHEYHNTSNGTSSSNISSTSRDRGDGSGHRSNVHLHPNNHSGNNSFDSVGDLFNDSVGYNDDNDDNRDTLSNVSFSYKPYGINTHDPFNHHHHRPDHNHLRNRNRNLNLNLSYSDDEADIGSYSRIFLSLARLSSLLHVCQLIDGVRVHARDVGT